MYPAMPGSPKTALTSEITASATSMIVDDVSVLPAAPNICVIGDNTNAEIVSYTGIGDNTVSGLVRGLGGTTASVWPAGATVARNFTSFDHDRFIENIEELEENKLEGVSWGDITGTITNQSDLNTALAEKAPLASPALTGNPTAPTQPLSTNNTRIANTAFVQSHAPIHLTVTASAGTTVTKTDSRITSTMKLINCVYGTPPNVASDVIWTTSEGSIIFTGTFNGSTTITFDLIETN